MADRAQQAIKGFPVIPTGCGLRQCRRCYLRQRQCHRGVLLAHGLGLGHGVIPALHQQIDEVLLMRQLGGGQRHQFLIHRLPGA